MVVVAAFSDFLSDRIGVDGCCRGDERSDSLLVTHAGGLGIAESPGAISKRQSHKNYTELSESAPQFIRHFMAAGGLIFKYRRNLTFFKLPLAFECTRRCLLVL